MANGLAENPASNYQPAVCANGVTMCENIVTGTTCRLMGSACASSADTTTRCRGAIFCG